MVGSNFVIYGDQIHKMVEQITTVSGALDKLRPHDKVIIKPNLVVSRREWVGVNTDPRIVEGIVLALKERGVSRIIVGDGSGMGYKATKAFKICGYNDLAKQHDLKLVDLERDRFIKKQVPIKGPFSELEIAQTVLDCDFLINVPVMKAHSQALVTCSLKNLKGVMPRAMKTAFHGVDLGKAIAQLSSVLCPDLTIIDGIQGDLSFETGRNPVAMGRILAGRNPVELDSVVAEMLGYAPRKIGHITHSADAGLGECDLDRIKVHSLNEPDREEHFNAPPHYSQRYPCRVDADGACCTCTGNLMFALERLKENGLLSKKQHFLLGQKVTAPSGQKVSTISVGTCAVERIDADIEIDKCPPSAGIIYRYLASGKYTK